MYTSTPNAHSIHTLTTTRKLLCHYHMLVCWYMHATIRNKSLINSFTELKTVRFIWQLLFNYDRCLNLMVLYKCMHKYGFAPVWIRTWHFSSLLSEKEHSIERTVFCCCVLDVCVAARCWTGWNILSPFVGLWIVGLTRHHRPAAWRRCSAADVSGWWRRRCHVRITGSQPTQRRASQTEGSWVELVEFNVPLDT